VTIWGAASHLHQGPDATRVNPQGRGGGKGNRNITVTVAAIETIGAGGSAIGAQRGYGA